jgi:hypothetical protein
MNIITSAFSAEVKHAPLPNVTAAMMYWWWVGRAAVGAAGRVARGHSGVGFDRQPSQPLALRLPPPQLRCQVLCGTPPTKPPPPTRQNMPAGLTTSTATPSTPAPTSPRPSTCCGTPAPTKCNRRWFPAGCPATRRAHTVSVKGLCAAVRASAAGGDCPGGTARMAKGVRCLHALKPPTTARQINPLRPRPHPPQGTSASCSCRTPHMSETPSRHRCALQRQRALGRTLGACVRLIDCCRGRAHARRCLRTQPIAGKLPCAPRGPQGLAFHG